MILKEYMLSVKITCSLSVDRVDPNDEYQILLLVTVGVRNFNNGVIAEITILIRILSEL